MVASRYVRVGMRVTAANRSISGFAQHQHAQGKDRRERMRAQAFFPTLDRGRHTILEPNPGRASAPRRR